MKTLTAKKRDSIIRKLLKDDSYMSHLTVQQQLDLINRLHKATSSSQVDSILNQAKKSKK